MWGDYGQKFAQARNLYLYMMAHPGKKLNFMGNELAQFKEFDEKVELDWFLLGYESHHKFHRFMRDLNHIYYYHSCLSAKDYHTKGFKWLDADNAAQSIYTFYREDEHACVVVVLNMTPNSFEHFRLGVPYPGLYTEIINSEKDIYHGSNMCNFFPLTTEDYPSHGQNQSINLRIAPFAGILFELRR
jgi:1,4-alpha-glucan branching enzyme